MGPLGHFVQLAAVYVVSGLQIAVASAEVVARVGDRTVSRVEVEEAVQAEINAGYFHRRVSEEALLEMRREVLVEIVRSKLDLLGGVDRGMQLDMEGARRQCAAMEGTLGSERYEAGIAERGWSREQHALTVAESMLGREARRRFVAELAEVTDAEVRAFYEAEIERWRVPASIHLWHVLLVVEEDQPENVWLAREREARALLERLENGEAFTGIARTESEDAYRVKGGDLDWVHRGQLVAELEAIAWSLEPDQYGGPVRSPEGVHILRVTDRRAARQLSFEEAEPTLRQAEEARRLAEAKDAWYGEIMKNHPVTVLDPELEGALD
jgi:hypothetical protein